MSAPSGRYPIARRAGEIERLRVQAAAMEFDAGVLLDRIGVGPDLAVPGHPEVYAVGDIAAITDARTEHALPQLGSVALQSGEHVGETIARRLRGKEPKPFKYRDKGTMATIGRGAAVVQMLGGRTMKGMKAQVAWGTVHLALGNGMPDLGGQNHSRIHWDIVKDLRMPGTRIELDGEVVQQDGTWLV